MLNQTTEIIAEVKTASPFGWKSAYSWEELFALAERIGDVISIHTDARWQGSFELLQKARSMTDKQILAKGIHADDAQIDRALGSGADWVLVVGRVPKTHLEHCLIEPTAIEQFAELPDGARAVWNKRDLSTGGLKSETFAQARQAWPGWLAQASYIRTVGDAEPTANAVLVGTHLPEFAASLKRS